jgi:hypothetical protein
MSEQKTERKTSMAGQVKALIDGTIKGRVPPAFFISESPEKGENEGQVSAFRNSRYSQLSGSTKRLR